MIAGIVQAGLYRGITWCNPLESDFFGWQSVLLIPDNGEPYRRDLPARFLYPVREAEEPGATLNDLHQIVEHRIGGSE